jgi:hypothetical protein
MRLIEFLASVDFLSSGDDNEHIVISINGKQVDVHDVASGLVGPLIIIPKSDNTE